MEVAGACGKRPARAHKIAHARIDSCAGAEVGAWAERLPRVHSSSRKHEDSCACAKRPALAQKAAHALIDSYACADAHACAKTPALAHMIAHTRRPPLAQKVVEARKDRRVRRSLRRRGFPLVREKTHACADVCACVKGLPCVCKVAHARIDAPAQKFAPTMSRSS